MMLLYFYNEVTHRHLTIQIYTPVKFQFLTVNKRTFFFIIYCFMQKWFPQPEISVVAKYSKMVMSLLGNRIRKFQIMFNPKQSKGLVILAIRSVVYYSLYLYASKPTCWSTLMRNLHWKYFSLMIFRPKMSGFHPQKLAEQR